MSFFRLFRRKDELPHRPEPYRPTPQLRKCELLKGEAVFHCPHCGSWADLYLTRAQEYIVGCTRVGNCYGNQHLLKDVPHGFTYREDALRLWNMRTD